MKLSISTHRKSYLNNVFNLQFAQIISIVSNLIFTALLVRLVSVDQYGRFIFFFAIVQFLSFLSLPRMNIIIRKGVLKNYDKIYGETIRFALRIAVITCLILVPIITGLMSFDLEIIAAVNKRLYNFISTFDWQLALVAVLFLLPSSFAKYEPFLIAKERYDLFKYLRIVDGALKITLICSTAFFFGDIFLVILSYVIQSCIMITIGNILVYKHKQSSGKNLLENSELFKEGLKYSIIDIVGFTARLDKVILGSIDPGLLALYHIGQRFPQLIKDHMKHFITPVLIRWGRQNRIVHIKKIKKNFIYLILAGLTIAIMTVIISMVFIPIIFGGQYNRSILIALLLCIPIISKPMDQVVLDYDTVQDDGKKYTFLMTVLPVIYTILIFYFIPKYNIYGLVSCQIILNVIGTLSVLGILLYNLKKI